MPKKHHKHQLTSCVVQRIDVNVRTVYRQLQFSSLRRYLTVQLYSYIIIWIGEQHRGQPFLRAVTVYAHAVQNMAYPHGTNATADRDASRHTSQAVSYTHLTLPTNREV